MRTNKQNLLVLYVVVFLTLAGFSIPFPVLPLIVLELNASSFHMGMMIAIYALCEFIFSPFWGMVSERLGRKRVMLVGLFGFSLSFFLLGTLQTIEGLLVARALSGILSAATLPTAQALVADSTSIEERAPAITKLGAFSSAGIMIGPIIGGVLATWGLRVPFLFTSGLSLAIGILATLSLREPKAKTVEQAPAGAGSSPWHPSQISAKQVLSYAAFSRQSVLFWMTFMIMLSTSTQFSMLGLFLTERFAGGAGMTSTAFTVSGVSSTFIQGLLVSRLIRKKGESRTISTGLVIGMAAFVGLAMAPNFLLAMVAVVGTASAMAFTRPVIMSLISQQSPYPMGVTMGIQAAFDSLGRVIGPLVAGMLFSKHTSLPFIGASAMLLLAFLVFQLFPREATARATTAPGPHRA